MIAVVFIVVLSLGRFNIAEEKRKYRPPNDAKETYEVKKIEGFSVLVSRRLKPYPEKRAEGLAEIKSQLRQIKPLVKPDTLKQLQKVEIWVEYKFPHRTQYHNDTQWLIANGYNPAKKGTIEIAKIDGFLEWRNRPVNTLLHELTHAYHDQVLGWNEPRILAAYEAAKKSGKYAKVMRDKGYQIPHYGIGNHKEYFAECTEAYLWVNDYYPFVYGELKQFDPKAFELMEAIWGKRFQPMKQKATPKPAPKPTSKKK